jgi:hypothetical protein
MDHFPQKPREGLLYGDVLQILHEMGGFVKVTAYVDKWISYVCNSGANGLYLGKFIFMKTIFTLTMAVVALAVRGQSSELPVKQPVLTHADSLVLAEAGAWLADSLLVDNLRLPDSLLHPTVRILDFHNAIDAILRDFPNNLRHVSGTLELAQGEFENYSSLIMLEGAANCTVTRWHSVDDTTASWQAQLFSGGDFNEASKQYHAIFRKLQSCYVKLVDGSVIYLNGDWEPAREGASFTTSTLRLLTGDWRYKEVKVELELAYQLADWAVRLNIVSKKRDDEVGGSSASTGL